MARFFFLIAFFAGLLAVLAQATSDVADEEQRRGLMPSYCINSPDGKCDDDYYNMPYCEYDGGDCCPDTCKNGKYKCGSNGWNCVDPKSKKYGKGASKCRDGTLGYENGDACCPLKCAKCGGRKCHVIAGADNCCTGRIKKSNIYCADGAEAPCILE